MPLDTVSRWLDSGRWISKLTTMISGRDGSVPFSRGLFGDLASIFAPLDYLVGHKTKGLEMSDYKTVEYDHNADYLEWINILKEYATGTKTWDTGGAWVCEEHPMMPIEQGYFFDCKCGGPGMPPSMPKAG